MPGVGANLQDHLETYVQHVCTQPITLYSTRDLSRDGRQPRAWLVLTRNGLGATNHFESGGFIRTRAGVDAGPDLQYHFLPIARSATTARRRSISTASRRTSARCGRPRAGRCPRSANPRDPPRILFNYLATEGDRQEFRDAIRLTREIFAQKAFDPYRGAELSPGPAVTTDAEIDAHIRRKAESAYHPSCTCKMGAADDPLAVVDGSLKVRGTEGLRVVDASIMPNVVSGNLNAPTIMIGEKAADIIRGQTPLPPLDVPIFIHPEWRTKQR